MTAASEVFSPGQGYFPTAAPHAGGGFQCLGSGTIAWYSASEVVGAIGCRDGFAALPTGWWVKIDAVLYPYKTMADDPQHSSTMD
jgi:hypothetical protein